MKMICQGSTLIFLVGCRIGQLDRINYLSDIANTLSIIYVMFFSHAIHQENMDLYVPRVIKDIYKRSFSYMAPNLWNQLPTDVKESATLDSFKQNYKHSKGWIK